MTKDATESEALKEMMTMPGIGKVTAEKLFGNGIKSSKQIANSTEEQLEKAGLKKSQIEKLLSNAAPILIKDRSSIKVDESQLIYDGNNHRFLGEQGADKYAWDDFSKEETITKISSVLWDQFSAGQIFTNMRANGISFQDRLVVAEWPDPSDKKTKEKKFVVLEGNRRLRAIKELKKEEDQLSPLIKNQLAELEVVELLYSDREELLERAKAMMAVRHLCGTKDWGPFAQASIIMDAVEKRKNYQEAAEYLGISEYAVRRDLKALSLYNAIQQGFSNPLSSSSDFATLRLLAQTSSTKKWLGLEFQTIPPKCSIGNSDNMGVLLRKWKSHGKKREDSGEITGENEMRKVKKLLDSAGEDSISDWADGTNSLENTILAINASNSKGMWPSIGETAQQTVESIPLLVVKGMGSTGVKQLIDLKNKIHNTLKDRKALVEAQVASLKKEDLVKLCEERKIDHHETVGGKKKQMTKEKLKKLLIKGY